MSVEALHVGAVEISVVCAPDQWAGDLAAVHREFANVLASTGRSAEFVFVLNGPHDRAERELSTTPGHV